ncbi:MAG: hypothetical protein ACOYNS_10465 [Bacteroidota bacterium]
MEPIRPIEPAGLPKPKIVPVAPEKLELISVPEAPKQEIVVEEPGIFMLYWLRLREKLKYQISSYQKGEAPMESNTDFTKIITTILIRLVLKVGGGAILALGLSTGDVTEIVVAVVGIVGGFIASWFNSKKLLATEPPKQ